MRLSSSVVTTLVRYSRTIWWTALSEESRRQDTSASLSKIEKDLKEVGGNSVHVDVRKAADDLSAAVVRAKDRAKEGKSPDMTPFADAAGRLSVACTKG